MTGRKKFLTRFLSAFLREAPLVLGMVLLIPLIADEYVLLGGFLAILSVGLSLRRERHDGLAFFIGLVLMTAGEILFVQTGIETFSQQSFFGIMPLWLPFLWGYGFVAIKRVLASLV
jgi:hypothetical protein